MKKYLIISTILSGMLAIPLGFNACGAGVGMSTGSMSSQQRLDIDPLTDPVVAGIGHELAGGVGALSVPTPDALIGRITNGLEGQVSSVAGSFQESINRFRSNLPKATDPTKGSGYDAGQLLVYGACADLTTGTTPKMQSVYNIPPNGDKDQIKAKKADLVAAGLRMLNKHTAGLASNALVKGDIEAALGKMLDDLAEDGSQANTTKIAFMSVCIAANSAGSMLLSF